MNGFKKFLKSPAAIMILFVIAGALILGGGIGGTLAWTNNPIFSEEYQSRIQLREIGVSLLEDHKMVSHRDYVRDSDYKWDTSESTYRLCDNLLGEGEDADKELKIGKIYDEVLTVENSGYIDEYVRVNVYKYWAEVDENGKILKKRTDLDPSTIDLHLITDGDWIEDPATTNDAERKTLYYKKVLTTNSGETTPFADTLKIDDVVATKVLQTVTYEGDYKVLTTTYDYDGLMFVIEAEVDAVQTHNAVAAIKSAWGKDVEISNGVITSIK